MSSPPPRDLPNPGIGPRSPALQADSLPSEPPGKPKNGVDTGVGNLSLPNPGIEPGSPALQVDSLPAERPGKPYVCVGDIYVYIYSLIYIYEVMQLSHKKE